MYKVLFDSICPGWRNDPEANLEYLKKMQKIHNDEFQEVGYLYLKDLLNDLNLAVPFPEGIGWWYDGTELPWEHENYISYGLYENPENRPFINGYIPNAILQFNVSGDLTNYMLDKAIYIGGPELAQDLFDYPWIHHNGLAFGGMRWEE